jgi:hypothetical protein
MGGGLLQLVAYGAQDVYLTGNPQITFFKVVYRRHTNFALESIQQTFNGTVGFGQRVTSTISRNGDLISRAYLELESSDKNLVPYFGLRVLKEAEVEIGGQKIDKHYSEWLYIWNELTMPVGKKEGFFNMVGGGGGQAVGHRLKLAKYIDTTVNDHATISGDINELLKNNLKITFVGDVAKDVSVLFRVKRFGSDGTTEKTIGTTIIKATKKVAVQMAELTVLSSYGYTIDDFKNDDTFELHFVNSYDKDKISTVEVIKNDDSGSYDTISAGDSNEYSLVAGVFMIDGDNYDLPGLDVASERIRIKKTGTDANDDLATDDTIIFKFTDTSNKNNFIIYEATVGKLYLADEATIQFKDGSMGANLEDGLYIKDFFKAKGIVRKYSQWYHENIELNDGTAFEISHISTSKTIYQYYIFKTENILDANVVTSLSGAGEITLTDASYEGETIKVVVTNNSTSPYTVVAEDAGYRLYSTTSSDTIANDKIEITGIVLAADPDSEPKHSNGKLISKMYVPLQFWFCNNYGLALPLIGLQYHEVKIIIQFEEASKCMIRYQEPPKDLRASLWIDYIYLDTDERRKFAQSSHEYLIEQLQYTGKESVQNKLKLNFNHPVKELVWVVNKNDKSNVDWFNFTNDQMLLELKTKPYNTKTINEALVEDSTNCVKSAKLILNGNDRFYERDGRYFNLVQPFQHHTNVPKNRGVNLYSFALKPEEHQPSGTLNMSRIDTATLSLNYESDVTNQTHSVSVYAVNYNVLRILSGMGGIAYSN